MSVEYLQSIFPTEEEIINDFAKWQEIYDKFSLLMKSAKYQKDLIEHRNNGITIMKKLFDDNIKPEIHNKQFDPSKVTFDVTDINSPVKRTCYTYNHQNVRINYIGSLTWRKGDCDYFADFSLILDEKLIASGETNY